MEKYGNPKSSIKIIKRDGGYFRILTTMKKKIKLPKICIMGLYCKTCVLNLRRYQRAIKTGKQPKYLES